MPTFHDADKCNKKLSPLSLPGKAFKELKESKAGSKAKVKINLAPSTKEINMPSENKKVFKKVRGLENKNESMEEQASKVEKAAK
jgi:hypothetical protein